MPRITLHHEEYLEFLAGQGAIVESGLQWFKYWADCQETGCKAAHGTASSQSAVAPHSHIPLGAFPWIAEE